MHRITGFIAAVCFFLVLVVTAEGAVVIHDVEFSKTVQENGVELPLRGAGLLTYLIFYKAYVGAFYLPEAVPSQNALGDVPRCLVLEYFHGIKAEDFARATTRKIKDNLDDEAFTAVEDRVAQFNALYRDVQPGDRYALAYIPGQGTTLRLNDKPLGRIEGDDFARAVFAIWLGERPIDKGFKRRLLGET